MLADLLSAILPPGVSYLIALLLMAASLAGSMITAAFGLGGGIFMLSVMTLIFPPAVVIPVHGAIQLGSNSGRAIVQRMHIQWQMVLWISLGAIFGSLVGGRFVAMMPEELFKILVGAFILFIIWVPRPDVQTRGPVSSFIGGVVTSFVGMIVGVAGPLVLTFIRVIKDRRELIATHAALMTFQNTAKILTFIFYGFAFAAYLPLILAMVAAGFVGTLIGSHILNKLPEAAFRTAFRALITLIALDLLRRGLT